MEKRPNNKYRKNGTIGYILLLCIGLPFFWCHAQCTQISNCDDPKDWVGGALDTTLFLEGSAALRWIPAIDTKITLGTALDLGEKAGVDFWLHSNVPLDQKISLFLSSNDPATSELDHYEKEVSLNFTGWKKFRLDFSDFKDIGTPKGFGHIDFLEFTAMGQGFTADPAIQLTIDDIGTYEAENTSKQLSSCDDLAGWSNGLTLTPEHKEGTHGIYWDFASTDKAILDSGVCDYSGHEKLTFWVHNNLNNGQRMRVLLDSQNPNTQGADYYLRDFFLDFTGWKKIEINLSAFGANRSPIGKDQIDKIVILANAWNPPITDNTVIIDDVRLENSKKDFDINAAFASKHPKLYIRDWTTFKARVNGSSEMQAIADNVISIADRVLPKPVVEYKVVGGRLLGVSREVVKRTTNLAMAYQLTNETKYLDKAYQELEAAVNFPDWHPAHFLDVGEMTFGVALGYDWLYNDLTPTQRETIRKGIATHGLETYLSQANAGKWWLNTKSNWAGVCNGGIGVGALAIAGTDPYLAHETINTAMGGLLTADGFISQYAPDGAWPEAPEYWEYATNYFIRFAAAMESAVGTSFDMLEHRGIDKTGQYPIHMLGTMGQKIFNYADNSGNTAIQSPVIFWLGDYFNDGLLTWYQKEQHKSTVFDLVWYPTDDGITPTEAGITKDAYFRDSEVATFRTSWDDPNGSYLGFKAGDNTAGHSQLDLGSFVFESHGVRWIEDLGRESYSRKGYLARNTWDSERWKFYKAKAEGNNTIVINPYKFSNLGYTADQDPFAKTKIIQFNADASGTGNVIADLTDAYDDFGATQVKRGLAFINNRKQFILQDEVTMSEPSDYWTFFNTRVDLSNITVSADGKKALLLQNGKQLICEILEPIDAKFQKMPGQQLPGLLEPEAGESAVPGKLAINVQQLTNSTVRVLFSPEDQGEPNTYSIPPLYALEDPHWPEGTPPTTTCTATAASGAQPEATQDSSLATIWSIYGQGHYLEYCFDSPVALSCLDIAFFKGDQQQTIFDLELLDAQNNWQTVFSKISSSGKTRELENFSFEQVFTKKIKLIFYGTNADLWNDIAEVSWDSCSCLDTDNDGICDSDDTTTGDCRLDAPCDDMDPCTLNDSYDADCNCGGVPNPKCKSEEELAERGLTVFPNPSRGLFSIRTSNLGPNTDITIFAMDGKLIWTARVDSIGQITKEVNAANWQKGTYIIVVRNESLQLTERIMLH